MLCIYQQRIRQNETRMCRDLLIRRTASYFAICLLNHISTAFTKTLATALVEKNNCATTRNRLISVIEYIATVVLEFGERLDLVLWETCHIYATCQAYRAEAEFQHSPISKRTEYAGPNGPIGLKP